MADTFLVSYTVPQCNVDFASEIDTLEEFLCDQFGISMKTAVAIAAWHNEQLSLENKHHDSDLLDIILGFILEQGNVRLKAIGLLFAAGINRTNGWSTERLAAKDTGFTPAAINAEKNAWLEILQLARNEHCKTDSAREKYKLNGLNNHWRKGFSKIK